MAATDTQAPGRDRATGQEGAAERASETSVLVVADHPNTGKIARHYGPLADVADETTMVCLRGADDVDGITFREAPVVGHRLVAMPLLFLLALAELLGGDYDAIVSISLFPYGTFALLLGRLTGTPVHLGIIGADLDRHAEAWYGSLPKALFRQFDAVSVPGTSHVERLAAAGVDRDRIAILTNTVDAETYRPPQANGQRDIDILWIGRFSAEKQPEAFVETLSTLASRNVDVSVMMIGDGDRHAETRRLAEQYGVADAVTFTGWVDEPLAYYQRSRTFVLTSRREGVPLTMLEAMASGVVPVVPPVGSVPDVAEHERNALVVTDRDPSRFADALERLLADETLRRDLAANATAVRESHALDAARDDWLRILTILGARDSRP